MAQADNSLLDPARDFVRKVIRQLAKLLNKISGGKLTPNMVTITGLIAHVPIAVLIATRHNILAAVLIVVFGLFDTLDGELARLQGSESNNGMVLDAVTDRFKEVMLYTAAGYSLIAIGQTYLAVWAILACGASLSVSYVKAKGEATYLAMHKDIKANTLFKDGFMRFEVRMVIIILGLLTNYVGAALVAIAIFASFTAISRLVRVTKKLNVQD
jgi:CDP-diacylglycerol--glycerol-3-phosphate 3-phosphatidyltransferase